MVGDLAVDVPKRDGDGVCLTITVIKAWDLPEVPSLGAYVVLKHPAFGRLATDVVQGSATPVFEEPFLCGMTRAELAEPLRVRIMERRMGRDATLAEGSVDLRAVATADHIEPVVTLARQSGDPGGTVALSIARRDTSSDTSAGGASRAADVEAWRARSSATARRGGFLRAWEKHLPEIVHLRTSRALSAAASSVELYRWIREDQEAAGILSPEVHARIALALAAEAAEATISRAGRGFHDAVRAVLHRAEDLPEVLEGDGRPMKCVRNAAFQNWGGTVKNTPLVTCIPRTKKGVANLVKWAALHDKRVRVSGYRHTWGALYSADREVLISLLPLDVVEDLPAREPAIDPSDELQGIEVIGTVVEDGAEKALCRIGAGTTNEQFRRWCLDPRGGNLRWTVPLNVIMVEITFGGSNAPICHGAGLRNRTLSDLVAAIEFVNAKGELQVVDDPEELKAAAGCFGLLGVVTAIVLKLDRMTFAAMRPEKTRVALTIPPPQGMVVPAGVDMTGVSRADLDRAFEDFVRRCEEDYYAEWFWFPYQKECWINTWKNDGDPAASRDYPGGVATFFEETEEYLGELTNQTLFKLLPARWQADLLATAAMLALPSGETIVTPLIDALHFRRGIQNMRVLDMELEIPIPPRADDPTKPDFTVCQKAWWAVIDSLYTRHATPHDAPMRIALEMRVMGDSGVTMAPQRDNRFGTCSIEVLTNLDDAQGEWLAFMQEIADAWTSHTDPSGVPLNVRPHWAKQWRGLTIRGLPVEEYLRTVAYKDRMPEFRAGLAAVARAGGCTLEDLRRRFGNPLVDELFAEVFDGPAPPR